MTATLHSSHTLAEDDRSTWLELWNGMSIWHRTPFLHPEVLEAVTHVESTSGVIVVRRAGQPVAFLPVQMEGRYAYPVARAVSNGDGIVAEEGLQLDVPKLLDALRIDALRWEHRDLRECPLGRWDVYLGDAAMVQLAGGWEDFARAVGARSSVLKQAARKRRKLQREVGEVVWELDAPISTDLHRLLEHKSEVLRSAGLTPTFTVERAAEVIRALHEHSGDEIRPVLSHLRAGGRLVAGNWGLAAGGRFVSCIPSYDPTLREYSPGVLLHVELLRSLPSIGVTLVDLGMDIDQTKRRLMTHQTAMGQGTVYRSSARRSVRRLRSVARQLIKGT